MSKLEENNPQTPYSFKEPRSWMIHAWNFTKFQNGEKYNEDTKNATSFAIPFLDACLKSFTWNVLQYASFACIWNPVCM